MRAMLFQAIERRGGRAWRYCCRLSKGKASWIRGFLCARLDWIAIAVLRRSKQTATRLNLHGYMYVVSCFHAVLILPFFIVHCLQSPAQHHFNNHIARHYHPQHTVTTNTRHPTTCVSPLPSLPVWPPAQPPSWTHQSNPQQTPPHRPQSQRHPQMVL